VSIWSRLYSGNPGFDFTRMWPRMLVVSGVAVLICLASLFTRGLELGIEFEGGGVWEVRSATLTVDDVEGALPEGEELRVQVLTASGGERSIRVQGGEDAYEDSDEIAEALADVAGVELSEVSINTVGSTWGDQITSEAERALLFFFIAIAAYISIRLEWKMAVGALVAVAHDIVITVGVYSVFQFVVTPATVIAFLTILGYSLYDTVVVFDKLREQSHLVGVAQRMTYTDMANNATNEVFMRSVNTSVTSLLPVLSILVVGSLIMGATALQEFGAALAVGLIVGAYSSLFIAVPAVIALKEREPHNRDVRERLGGHQGTLVTDTTGPATAVPGERTARPATVTPAGSHPPRPRKKGKRR
jgi:preprotein translocase subunit SecF